MDRLRFSRLINEHQAVIWKVCRIYAHSREDREDIFQEIAYQLWKSRHSFKEEAKFTTWMYRIALNTAITSLRRKKPDLTYPGNVPDQKEDTAADETIAKRERLAYAINTLDDVEKAIITFYMEEMSYAEIAAAMGISENYVGVKLNRIKDKLKKITRR